MREILYNTLDDEDGLDWLYFVREVNFHLNTRPLVVEANIQRWNGKTKYYGVFDDFETLVNSIARSSSYEMIRVIEDNRKLIIELSHHDGVNCFEIKSINNDGLKLLDNHNKLEVAKKLMDSRYSKRPGLSQKMWAV